jgi:NAD(P)-dependent dehydrogenase (short-subunit alcohol dehydrogenase family)
MRLAEAGAAVAVLDLDDAGAANAADAVSQAHGVRTLGLAVDVTDTGSLVAAFDTITTELDPIAILVNNAGVYPATMLLDMTDEQWDHVLDINLKAVFVASREAGNRMVENGGGVIVNIASVSGIRSSRGGRGHYVASKHGVIGLTKAFGTELAPHGIRVLGVAPTTVDTPGLAEQMSSAPGNTDWIRELGAALPLGRGCVPDDIARAVLFCASDMAAMMTSSTILVDGGQNSVM